MKIKLLTLILLCLTGVAFAQSADFKWAKGIGSSGIDNSTSIVVDEDGNTYTTGFFNGLVDFDPDSAKTFELSSGGNEDIFILKLNASGILLWAKNIGSTSNDRGLSIALDKWGNIVLGGFFSGTVDFDPDPGKVVNISSSGNKDAFVMKLSNEGSFIWAVKFGSTSPDMVNTLITDANGFIYSSGSFSATVDFDPGNNTVNLISNGNTDVFISKLDSSGSFIWAKQIGGAGIETSHSLSADANGNIYQTGDFQSTVDFDPGSGKYQLGTKRGTSYLLKLDANGNFGWVKNSKMHWGISDRSMMTDKNGNIYICGWFTDTVDLNFDTTVTNNFIAKGQHDIFVLKIDAGGNYAWAKSIGGNSTSNAEASCLTLDVENNVYIAGFFTETVDFDPGAGVFSITSSGLEDLFILQLNSSGNFVWVRNMRGLSEATSIAADPYKNIFITGIFSGLVDFDPKTGVTYHLGSKGNWDVSVQKIVQCKSSSSAVALSVCKRLLMNGKMYTASGKYIQTIPNAIGCDSTINLDLTVTTIDTGVFQNGNQLFTRITGPGYTYQWINCKTGEPLPGKIFASFNPSLNGEYAVVISYNNCSDTSACFVVSTIGIEERRAAAHVTVFPNPVNGDEINIHVSKTDAEVSLMVYNIQGQLLLENFQMAAGNNMLDISGLAVGIYTLDVNVDGIISRIKLVKTE